MKSWRRRLKNEITGYLFVLPQLFLFLALMIYPIFSGFRMSLFKITLKSEKFVGLANYINLLSDPNFIKSLWNTVMFVVCIVVLAVGLGLVVSAAIFDKAGGYVSFVRACYYIPIAVSMTVMTVVWNFLLNPSLGLVNYLLGKASVGPINFLGDVNWVMPIIIFVTFVSNIGQVIVLYVASMVSISSDVLEAAEVDGCGKVGRFVHIIFPLVKPTTLYVLITEIIAVIKIYVVIQLMTNGGPNHASSTLMYYLYEKAFELNNRMGEAAAIGVIMFVICMLLSLIQVAIFADRDKTRSRRRKGAGA